MSAPPVYDPDAPKKATNLSINADLLKQARALKLNLSRELETHLARVIAEKRRRKWLEQNRAGIEAYNRHVERHGVFSEGLRTF